jgi:ribA/ribD-fused uncharacterized protein
MADEQFTLFWAGIFSQWYQADFVIDDVRYCCCEQYMMAEKAKLFGDGKTLAQIMGTRDPKQQKKLGRQVAGFDKDVWERIEENGKPYCWNIVYQGNVAKFQQNPGLGELLQKTAGTTLVEASPYDKIWGIGLGEDDPRAKERSQWQGTNWLGEVLTQVREDLRGAGTE